MRQIDGARATSIGISCRAIPARNYIRNEMHAMTLYRICTFSKTTEDRKSRRLEILIISVPLHPVVPASTQSLNVLAFSYRYVQAELDQQHEPQARTHSDLRSLRPQRHRVERAQSDHKRNPRHLRDPSERSARSALRIDVLKIVGARFLE
jgi:hypothetical protein